MAVGGSALNMERLTYDLFACIARRFIPDVVIPESKTRENNYEQPDFIHIISVPFIAYQLECRDLWKPLFVQTYRSNRMRKFKHVSELLEEVLRMDKNAKLTLMRTLNSVALISELIQFLYSKNCNLFLNELVSFWCNYFAGYQGAFENAGGFPGFYRKHKKEPFLSLDQVIDNFIQKYCLPYGKLGVEVTDLFKRLVKDDRFFQTLKKPVVPDTKDERDPSALDSSFREKLTISSKLPRKVKSEKIRVSDSLENTGLGIRKHEELIRDCYSSVDDAFSEKYDIESGVEGGSASEIQRPEGQSKGQGSSLTGSPLSPKEQSKDPGDLTVAPLGSERQSKGLDSLGGSPLGPERQIKGQESLTESPFGLEGQSTGCGSLSVSPASPEEQKPRRDSPRTPKGISRLEQKRLKYLQSKKASNEMEKKD